MRPTTAINPQSKLLQSTVPNLSDLGNNSLKNYGHNTKSKMKNFAGNFEA